MSKSVQNGILPYGCHNIFLCTNTHYHWQSLLVIIIVKLHSTQKEQRGWSAACGARTLIVDTETSMHCVLLAELNSTIRRWKLHFLMTAFFKKVSKRLYHHFHARVPCLYSHCVQRPQSDQTALARRLRNHKTSTKTSTCSGLAASPQSSIDSRQV